MFHNMIDMSLAKVIVHGKREDHSMTVTLWCVRGLTGYLFPTKMAAEMAARNYFPKDEMETNYGRVGFINFMQEH